MKILVLGGGGREHALVWKLNQSPRVEKIWCAPGNGGIAAEAECVAIEAGERRRDRRACPKDSTRSDHRGTGTAAGERADRCVPAAELGHGRAFSAGGAARREQGFLERISKAAWHSHRKDVRHV